MRKFSAVLFALLILGGCGLAQKMETASLKIGNIALTVEVAKTPSQMAQGLSGRTDLCASCGMLFSYNDSAIRTFWMKNMNFPLDFIWISGQKIVGLSQNVPITDESGKVKILSSFRPVNRVLELSAGWIGQNSVKIGDLVPGLD
ncbi:MAG: DUF192 domain-containing protein [Candidatus Komeilibacteria bacterium]|nr:DUF192 domain-containing protein [Candidatus Komeilibacteria bacterium]